MGRQCVELGGCMSQQFYTMKELPVSERPYEKAKEQGAAQNQDVILCSKECFENMGCKCAGMSKIFL